LAGLDPAIHAAVQAATLEAETKCRANTERSAWRHRADAPTIKKLSEKNKSFLVLFFKKELLPSCPT
jgi:hypothetical protein